jgi:hypothetical protein
MKLQFMAPAYPQATPKTTYAYFGHNNLKDKISFSNRNNLLHDVQSGKVTGVEALKALAVRYPNLGYYGSPNARLPVLNPAQVVWHTTSGEYIPDGPPTVVAHPDYRLSLFHALVFNRLGKTHGYYLDDRNHSLVFRLDLTPREWADLKRSKRNGFIYILNPDGMTVYRQIPTHRTSFNLSEDQKSLEFRSEQPISPLASVQVTIQDFVDMVKNDQSLQLLDGKGKPLDLT